MKLIKLSLIALMATTVTAHAGIYLRGGLYYGSHEDISLEGTEAFKSSIKNATGITAAVGFKFSALRIEGELNYMETDISDTSLQEIISSGDYKKASLFANALFEIPMTPFVEPYVGVGVGITQIDVNLRGALSDDPAVDFFNSSADDTTFSVQFLAGLRFSLLETVSVYGGYRYVITEGLTSERGAYKLTTDNGAHIFEVGVGLGF